MSARRSQPRRAGLPAKRRIDELGGEQVEGRRAVRELLVARRRDVRDVWISDQAGPSPIIAEIVELAEAAQTPLRRVPRARLDAEARTEASQGVLAHAQPLVPVLLEELCRPQGGPPPFLLVLEGVTDPQNLGALLRSAELAGVTGVVLPRHRAVRVTPAVTKAAAGALEYLALATVPGIAGALRVLSEHGLWTVGLEPESPESLFGLGVGAQPLALVLGSEERGLSRLTASRCELRVSIPQAGRLGALNVAAAGAVGMFEVLRQRLGLSGGMDI